MRKSSAKVVDAVGNQVRISAGFSANRGGDAYVSSTNPQVYTQLISGLFSSFSTSIHQAFSSVISVFSPQTTTVFTTTTIYKYTKVINA